MNAARFSLKPLFGAVMIAALFVAVVDLWRAAEYELLHEIWGDSGAFWTVGRGMVNGLQPYTDLFEIKPPGIFWTSAFSYAVGGSMTLGHLASAVVICVLPFLFLVPNLKKSRRTVMLAFLFGTVLATFTSWNSSAFQVEAFGSVFAVAYAVLLEWMSKKQVKWPHVALATVAIGGSVVYKEPFLFSCAAVALLSCETPKRFFLLFVVPTLCASFVGVGILAFLGYLDPYLNMYLAEMLGHHVSRHGSPFIRGLDIARLLSETVKYSPLFVFLLAALAAAYVRVEGKPLARADIWKERVVVLCVAGLAGSGFFHLAAIGIVNPSEVMRSLLWVSYAVSVVFAIGFFASAVWLLPTSSPSRVMRLMGAFLLATLAAGSGGEFYDHHLVFAVPVFASLMLMQLRTSDRQNVHGIASFVIILLIATTFFHSRRDNATAIRIQDVSIQKATAAEVDRILTACGLERYLHLGGLTSTLGFTKHSPFGPLFWQRNDLLDDERNADFQQSVLKVLEAADVVLYREDRLGGISEEIHASLKTEFTALAPACAGTVATGLDGTFLFRKRFTGRPNPVQ